MNLEQLIIRQIMKYRPISWTSNDCVSFAWIYINVNVMLLSHLAPFRVIPIVIMEGNPHPLTHQFHSCDC